MAEKRQESGFTVTDRRLFTEDGELSTQGCGASCARSTLKSNRGRGNCSRCQLGGGVSRGS
jgi:hypothetical protein